MSEKNQAALFVEDGVGLYGLVKVTEGFDKAETDDYGPRPDSVKYQGKFKLNESSTFDQLATAYTAEVAQALVDGLNSGLPVAVQLSVRAFISKAGKPFQIYTVHRVL